MSPLTAQGPSTTREADETTASSATVRVRPLVRDDGHAWWRLRLRALADHPDAFAQDLEDAATDGERLSRERFETLGIGGNNRIFGALAADGALVGMAGIVGNDRRKLRHRMEIGGVYVAPEARGTGAGRALIEACIDHARQVDGVMQIHIGVAAHNHAAARLYERCGFTRYAREPRLLLLHDGTTVDEDLMVLMLDR